jgi:HipA-like protein
MQDASASSEVGDHVFVTAVQHIRSMRGGAQAQLMRCSDGNLYVVKFRNNPQNVKVLANDFVVSKLARALGLTVPMPAIVSVDEALVEGCPGLRIQLPGRSITVESGLQFGSQYAIDPIMGRIQDFLPPDLLALVRNFKEFAGILALDKWVCNHDGRQAVFGRRGRERKYTAYFIDHGYSFGAGEWCFPDHPLRGTFCYNAIYDWISGWDCFEPWLSRLEVIDPDVLWSIVGSTPPTWYDSDWDGLQELTEILLTRRKAIRDLILEFRDSPRRPFPNWDLSRIIPSMT